MDEKSLYVMKSPQMKSDVVRREEKRRRKRKMMKERRGEEERKKEKLGPKEEGEPCTTTRRKPKKKLAALPPTEIFRESDHILVRFSEYICCLSDCSSTTQSVFRSAQDV